MYNIIKNIYGFYEVDPKPSKEELNSFYENQYFQKNHSTYSSTYSDCELEYFANVARIAEATINCYQPKLTKSLLDLGCGEGFFSKYFLHAQWDVTAVDFSSSGIRNHNPEVLDVFNKNDIFEFISDAEGNGISWGLINLDNVLEHVLEPVSLLRSIKNLMTNHSILRIEVPNDFSSYQKFLFENGHDDEHWVSPPQHLSYFSVCSLRNLLEQLGFKILSLQADYNIEQFILNKHSNYVRDKSLGKQAYMSRILNTNYLARNDVSKLMSLMEISAELDFGRLLTTYVKLDKCSQDGSGLG